MKVHKMGVGIFAETRKEMPENQREFQSESLRRNLWIQYELEKIYTKYFSRREIKEVPAKEDLPDGN